MERNTTPTTDLINDATDLYASLLTVLDIPFSLYTVARDGSSRIIPVTDVQTCQGIEHAARYHAEAITTPLIAAHNAMHALTVVCLDRANVTHDDNSPYGIVARAEIKRCRLVIAESEATIRREMARTETRLHEAIDEILRGFGL